MMNIYPLLKNIFIVILLLAFPLALEAQISMKSIEDIDNPNFFQIKSAAEDSWKNIPIQERKGWKQYKRWEYFWGKRTFPSGEFPNPQSLLTEINSVNKEHSKNNKIQAASNWKLLGPVNHPEVISGLRKQGIGRINRVRFHPTNANEIWIGSASGGVWKTIDGGKTWQNFPFTQFLSLGVSDIAISQSNPNIVYVATGDVEPAYSKKFYTVGLIKTTDAGATWSVTGISHELENSKQVASVLVHPTNPDIVIVGSSDGILKSTDGGVSWDYKRNGGYFTDLEFMPSNPNYIYGSTLSWAGSCFIVRSTDLGETWSVVNEVDNSNRIALAVTPANSDRVYALCSDRNGNGFNSFWRSDDQGETWEMWADTSTEPNILGWYKGTGDDKAKGQGYYDLCLAVSPTNFKEVYTGGINIWRSKAGGTEFEGVTHWWGAYSLPFVHADHHDLVYQNNSNVIFSANDGGLSKSSDGGKTWIDLTDGISITQFYKLGSSNTDPELVVGGSQDNGTSMYKSGKWYHIYSSDGMECAVDPNDADIIYVSSYYGNIQRSDNGGLSFQGFINADDVGEEGEWVTPYEIDKTNSQRVYVGYKNLWRTADGGENWENLTNYGESPLIQNIILSPTDHNYIYFSTNTTVYGSYDYGKNWITVFNSSQALSSIAVDPNNPKRIFITTSGYAKGYKVFEYNPDYGETAVRNISGNLPNVPVNTIVYQKDSPDRIYVGTDIGVFYSDYGSANWEIHGASLPNVVVNELEIQESSKKIRAATFGRGIWETSLNQCNLPQPTINVTGNLTFCEGDSVILTVNENYNNYLWSNGASTKSVTIKEAGVYSVVIEVEDGCKAKSTAIYVDVRPHKEILVKAQGKHPICEGDTAILYASFGFDEYLWSTGETSRKINVTTPGTYTCFGRTSDGCPSNSEPFEVIVSVPEKPSIYQIGDSLIASTATSYQWYYNDALIEGATQQKIKINEFGKYKVIIQNEYDCDAISDEINVISDVEENDEINNHFQIHPNPSSGLYQIKLKLDKPVLVNITIIDLLGNKILNNSIQCDGTDYSYKIDLSNYNAGMYYAIITINGKSGFQKLIKE